MADAIESTEKLIDVFNKTWTAYHEINRSSEPTNSPKLQQAIDNVLSDLLFLSKSVEQLSMFSDNEELEEIATPDLRYFLLNALTACLTSKKQCDIKTRPGILQKSLSYFVKFLNHCSQYNIGSQSEIENSLKSGVTQEVKASNQSKPDLKAMNATREAKIMKFRKSKLQTQQIQEMESKLHDEEIARKYWILQITQWTDTAIDELASMRMELSMLIKFKDVPKEEIEEARKPVKGGMKPFILTKDKLQASVFGAGYPSIPTVTLEEYFEKEAAANRLPDQASKPASDRGKLDKESDSDEDDDEKVKKQRDFDDWKDTHRRGAGNRKNMG